MKTYALFAGVNNYPGTGMDLGGCINDAQDWRVLIEPHCDKVVMLLDSMATREALIGTIRQFIALMKPGDRLVGTWSGHGTWKPDLDGDEPDGRDECIVPFDYNNLISDDEIHRLLMDRPQDSSVFFVTDSCNSGTVYRMLRHEDDAGTDTPPRLRFIDPARLGLTDEEKAQGPLYARRLRAPKVVIAPGLIHMAGCQDPEYCYDATMKDASGKKRGNGAFTYYALKALQGMRKGSSYSTWHRRIRDLYLPSYQYPQSPMLNAGKEESKLAVPWKV